MAVTTRPQDCSAGRSCHRAPRSSGCGCSCSGQFHGNGHQRAQEQVQAQSLKYSHVKAQERARANASDLEALAATVILVTAVMWKATWRSAELATTGLGIAIGEVAFRSIQANRWRMERAQSKAIEDSQAQPVTVDGESTIQVIAIEAETASTRAQQVFDAQLRGAKSYTAQRVFEREPR